MEESPKCSPEVRERAVRIVQEHFHTTEQWLPIAGTQPILH